MLVTLGVAAVLTVVLLLRERDHDRRLMDFIASTEVERQLLLDRIERPGTVVAPATTTAPVADAPVDEIERLRREYEGVNANGSN